MKSTKYLLYYLPLFSLLLGACSSQNNRVSRTTQSVLFLSGTEEHCLSSVLQEQLAQMSGADFLLNSTSNWNFLQEDSVKNYSTIILFNIDEDSLQIWHQSAIERYVEAGGGLILMDSSAVTPFLWPFYEKALQHTDSVEQVFVNVEHGAGRLAIADLAKTNCQNQNLKTDLSDLLSYAIGDNSYDYSLTVTPAAPKFSRYTKVVLDNDIYEPMEMAILPDCKVIFLERRGKMKLYDPYDKVTRLVANFDVCIEGNYEDGLQGIAIDPNYGKGNRWIYVYYSPPCENPNQLLSRFVFKNDSLHWATEKVMLEVKVQRETCCHSGGSVEFGPDGLLYLSTGDNTSSKESDGYTPTDERPGRGPFDAQKSSANKNDLRGKILRIKPEADGSYSIPEGNLFAADGSEGRPEIYTMGCRNPFRISIDAKTNYLYWGDVGPDVGKDGRYGPQSYDEWNQARSAGNFGWPYFVGDNKAYPDRNFETDEVGAAQDPATPINDSPNNTGGKNLPAAQAAWIWYPYGNSDEFPLLGTGSRSAMAGPIYYKGGQMPLSTVSFPEYYEGKFFIYEWARSWIKVLTMDEDGNLKKMESFMPETPFIKPIELEFGPDGALYILEYGQQYFMNNPEAKLSRIEFASGNRLPIPMLMVDAPAGAAPHTVNFSAEGSFDYDAGDELSFEWQFTKNEGIQASGEKVSFTFEEPGIYHPTLWVKDQAGGVDTMRTTIKVGNALPNVEIALQANRSFYFNSMTSLPYQILISDREDEQNGGIAQERVMINVAYVEDEDYLNDLSLGKQKLPDGPLKYVEGLKHINESDCLSCHHEEKENIGPSYRAVAERYKGDYLAAQYLAKKIINGGNGNWGEKIMAGHPQLSLETAEKMSQYILSLADSKQLPMEGNFNLKEHQNTNPGGGYVISAAYKDKGANKIPELMNRAMLILRSPKIEAEACDEMLKGNKSRFGDNREFTQVGLRPGGYLKFDNIDLTGLKQLEIRMKHRNSVQVSLRKDRVDGPVIGKVSLTKASGNKDWTSQMLAIAGHQGLADIYLVMENDNNTNTGNCWIDWLEFKR